MARLTVFALVVGCCSISMGAVRARVCLSDGTTPLEWADPNVPFVYRDIMVGARLTIIISSDTGGAWSGKLEVTGPDVGHGVLSARDYNDVTRIWEGSVREAAGYRAQVREYGNSLTAGVSMSSGLGATQGDWFIVDYTATTAGPRTVGLFEYLWEAGENSGPFNPPVPIVSEVNELVFSHVPSRDFNGDTKVDFVDYAILCAFRGMTDCTEPDWCGGADLDTDGDVDADDLMLFADYWLESTQ